MPAPLPSSVPAASPLRRDIPDLKAPVYSLAGLPAMVEAMRDLLGKLGVPLQDIRFEAFLGYRANPRGGQDQHADISARHRPTVVQ